jgi:hypothetical protein
LDQEVSIDALRLAGRLKDRKGAIPFARVLKICVRMYEEGRTVEAIAQELVDAGFIDHHPLGYIRTEMVYTHELSTYLKSWVTSRHAKRKKREVSPLSSTTQVNIVRNDIDPVVALWFGYPLHPVYLTGRRFYLEDDE